MTAFSAPAPVQGSVQCPPLPFVPARARVVEFERLREELRRTEVVREKQLEMLHALTNEVLHELDVPQVWFTPLQPSPPPLHPVHSFAMFLIFSFGSSTVHRSPLLPSPSHTPVTVWSPSQSRSRVSQSTIRPISKSAAPTNPKEPTRRLPRCPPPRPSRSHTTTTVSNASSSPTPSLMALRDRTSSPVAACLKRARAASSGKSSVAVGAPVNGAPNGHFRVLTGGRRCAVRRRKDKRRGMLVYIRLQPLLLRLVPFISLSQVPADLPHADGFIGCV